METEILLYCPGCPQTHDLCDSASQVGLWVCVTALHEMGNILGSFFAFVQLPDNDENGKASPSMFLICNVFCSS